MPRLRRARPEDAIQKAVLQHIKQRGSPHVFALHIPNGGKRRPVEAAILKGLGVRAGAPDLLMIHQGRAYGLELKSDVGKLSPAQIETLEDMERAGAICHCAYGLDDALGWLEQRGILRGKAA